MRHLLSIGVVLLACGALPARAAAMPGYLSAPIWSPDGARIAFAGDAPGYGAYVLNSDGSHPRRILRGVPLLGLAWSPDGQRFAYSAYPKRGGAEIWTVRTSGRDRVNITKRASKHRAGNDGAPAFSPDGRSIAFERFGDIAVVSSTGAHLTFLTHDRVSDGAPTWSPDGRQIAFLSMRGGCCPNPGDEASFDLYVMNADGSGIRPLTHDAYISDSVAWSPDSAQIAYSAPAPAGGSDIFAVDVATTAIRNVTQTPTNDDEPAWSPDGLRIAYRGTADPSGNSQGIYVMNADGSSQTRITAVLDSSADSSPAWSPNGARIALLRNVFRDAGPLGFIYSVNGDGSDPRRLVR